MRYRTAIAALGFVACAAGGALAACAASDTGGSPTAGPDASGSDASVEGGSPRTGGGADCDANVENDRANCGACGNACPAGETCNAGQCQECTAPEEFCDAGCVDPTNDLQNCGACGALCQAPQEGVAQWASPVCRQGSCDFTCQDASTEGGGPPAKCATGCFDLMTSAQNCGACGQACGSGQTDDGGDNAGECVSGTCGGYVVSNPTTLAFLDACSLPGHTSVLADVAQWTATGVVPLPFAFTFFGAAQTEVWLQSQGAIGFGKPSTVAPPDSFPCAGQELSCADDSTTNYPAAVAFGDGSLSTSGNGVCYASVGGGDAGSPGQFVVTWSQAFDTNDPGSLLTFSIALTQGTSTIDFMYLVAENLGDGVGVGGGDGGGDGGGGDGGGGDGGAGGGGGDGGAGGGAGGVGDDAGDPLAAGAQAAATVGIQAGISLFTPVASMTQFIPSTPFDIRFTPVH
jgi:hypothetical protein